MKNTPSRLYVYLAFTIEKHIRTIPPSRQNEVEKYITDIIQKQKHTIIDMNCAKGYIQIFIDLHPAQSIAQVVKMTKKAVQKFMQKQDWMPLDFQWQKGYRVFLEGKSMFNQEEIHQKQTFKEAFLAMLQQFDETNETPYPFDFY